MTNPVKKINMLDAVKLFFKNYFNFRGRASRSEYWWFLLAYFIVAFIIAFIEGLLIPNLAIGQSGPASNLLTLALFIGQLSLTARRLQDRGHTGWWQLAYFVPLIPLIYFAFLFILTEDQAHLISAGLVSVLWIIILITFIVVLCLPPKEDENKWGRNPLLPETSLTDQIPD